MCGRYVVAYDPQTLVAGFSLTRIQPFERRWNIAPTSAVPVVYQTKEGERVGELMRWGLVPHWARDTSIGTKLNNARSEGMADKPSFRPSTRPLPLAAASAERQRRLRSPFLMLGRLAVDDYTAPF